MSRAKRVSVRPRDPFRGDWTTGEKLVDRRGLRGTVVRVGGGKTVMRVDADGKERSYRDSELQRPEPTCGGCWRQWSECICDDAAEGKAP